MSNAMWSEENSIESLLVENYVVDIGSNQETNSSCLECKDSATWSEEGVSFESLLLENIETNSACHKWSEESSIESFLLESYIVDIVCNRETNSSYLEGPAMWSEERSSIEYPLTENYSVDQGSNRETNFSCLRGKDGAMLSEEWSSIESLLTKNYIDDLEFLTQSPSNEIKGLAMQQHEHHAKSMIHEPRSEEEEVEDKNNKDVHVVPKQQVCNGVWTFEEQGQQIQGPHEQ
ncbi:hypothetical protein H5410_029180, partial [Solanum commersonii]